LPDVDFNALEASRGEFLSPLMESDATHVRNSAHITESKCAVEDAGRIDQTVAMKKRRAIIALILTITLPYSAVAAIVDGGRCHHDSVAAHGAGRVPIHHDQAAMGHAHYAAPILADHDKCACSIKCVCANHCGGSVNSAAFVGQPFEVAVVQREGAATGNYSTFIPDTGQSPAFRPPIAALPSAA
jgi:hypothetical protein